MRENRTRFWRLGAGILCLIAAWAPAGLAAINAYQDENGNWVLKSRTEDVQAQSVETQSVETEDVAAWYPARGARYKGIIDRICRVCDLPQALVLSVIEVESGFNPNAVSRKGAKGLMQLMPETAKDMGVSNVFDPEENIRGGCKYLRLLIDKFGDRIEHVLAGYNAGPLNVEKYGGVPPFRETTNYVRSVKDKVGFYAGLIGEQPLEAPPPAAVFRVSRPLRAFTDSSGTIHVTNRP